MTERMRTYAGRGLALVLVEMAACKASSCRKPAQEAPKKEAMPDIRSLPELFRNNGYFTAGIGKIFHLAEDTKDRKGKPVKFVDALSWEFFYDGMDDATRLGKAGVGRDLIGDPLEENNLIAEQPEIAKQLRQAAREHQKQFPPPNK